MVTAPVVASGPALPASECAPVVVGVGLVVPVGVGLVVLVGVVCERVSSPELVGGCSDDNTSAAGVDGGEGGAAVVTVGGSPEVLSAGAWPGVTVAPAVGRTVTVDTSAAPGDVSAVAVCPCARVMDGLEIRGKIEECCYLFKAFTVSFQCKWKTGKISIRPWCVRKVLLVQARGGKSIHILYLC